MKRVLFLFATAGAACLVLSCRPKLQPASPTKATNTKQPLVEPDLQTSVPLAVADPAREPGPFDEHILTAVAEYKKYVRESDQSRVAPTDCRMQPPSGVALSASDDRSTHGQKLYFLYVKDEMDYTKMSWPSAFGERAPTTGETTEWCNAVGQVLVKESFVAEKVPLDQWPEQSVKPFDFEFPPEYAEMNGALYKASALAGLFVMIKFEPTTPGTDLGWVYATVLPDGQTIVQSGRIASCMGCHQLTDRDRLYGSPRSWPRAHETGEVKLPLNR